MSTGGIFSLIVNDGKADKVIYAAALLRARLANVMRSRAARGLNPTPTLADIEKTHILMVNAHYKPHVAIAFEYNKNKQTAGSVALGATDIQFSIPQFGDFFFDMVGYHKLSAAWSSSLTSPAAQAAAVTQGAFNAHPLVFPLDTVDWNNAAVATGTTTYTMCDPFGRNIATSTAYRNLVRYVEYPGERLYRRVKFDVNGNALDEYNDITTVMLRKFTICTDKLDGYKKLMGQEVCLEGRSGPKLARLKDEDVSTAATVEPGGDAFPPASEEPAAGSANTVNTPATYLLAHYPQNVHDSAIAGSTTAVATNTPVHHDIVQSKLWATHGPQTPKYWQPPLELWVKLNFWFNNDIKLCIPSVSIPYGQRFITIDFATKDELLQEFPGLFVKQTWELLTVADSQRRVRYRPYWQAGTLNDVTIDSTSLYINNIFVTNEIHDIYIKRIGFSLVRVFRHQNNSVTKVSEEILLSQLKWPIECMYIGVRPDRNFNVTKKNPNYHRDWHRFAKVFDLECNNHTYVSLRNVDDGGPALSGLQEGSEGQVWADRFLVEEPIVKTLGLKTHSIKIYDDKPAIFYNQYLPYQFGARNVISPQDKGVMLVNFNLHPGEYQPTGHLNLSRARETYLTFTSDYIGTSTPCTLSVVAVAINFLLITDGSAVLRYST
jgi:hypothetical protein